MKIPKGIKVNHILERAQRGDPKAVEELLPLVYETN